MPLMIALLVRESNQMASAPQFWDIMSKTLYLIGMQLSEPSTTAKVSSLLITIMSEMQ